MLTQEIIPNTRTAYLKLCKELNLKIEVCNGSADAPFDKNGRCKNCKLPVRAHKVSEAVKAAWES